MMKVYLDNCCFNRPFDDQSGILVRIETEAKLFVQHEIRAGRIELAWSSVNEYENNDNPSQEKAERIAVWRGMARDVITMGRGILEQGAELERAGLKPKDASHVAAAIAAGCDFFLTTDKGILNKNINGVRVANPVSFVEVYQNEK
jgi:predicted nucleic acid-binding protein